MIRNIKALILAGLAVLAMSAVFAGGAQASQFTCGSYPCTGTGEQPKATKHVFTVQGQKVECEEAHFEGSLAAASETIKVTPKYNKCTAFGIANAAVIMNSCYYDFTGGVTTTVPTHHFKGSVQVKCTTANDTITVNAPATNPLCTVHIPEQTPGTPAVDFESLTPTGTGVFVNSTVSGITSVVTDLGGFFCPLTGNNDDKTGSYTGTVNFLPLGGNSGHIS